MPPEIMLGIAGLIVGVISIFYFRYESARIDRLEREEGIDLD